MGRKESNQTNKTAEANVIIIIRYVQPNETKTINKVKVDLSAKVTHIWVPSIYSTIIFSETINPIELKFYR